MTFLFVTLKPILCLFWCECHSHLNFQNSHNNLVSGSSKFDQIILCLV
jgi:hypothetical protein